MRCLAFDSGVGGLSAIVPLLKAFPGLEIDYLGDLANLPYGSKSPERVKHLTLRNIEGALNRWSHSTYDAVIVACNTASAHALVELRQFMNSRNFQGPVVGVVEPSCEQALSLTPQRIVILATSSCVASLSYPKTLQEKGWRGPILQKACPLFVPLVEDGLREGVAVEEICQRYLSEILKPQDTVILGCTHYPFLLTTLKKLFPTLQFIEAGQSLVSYSELRTLFKQKQFSQKTASKLKFFATDTNIKQIQVQEYLQALDVFAPAELLEHFETIPPFI